MKKDTENRSNCSTEKTPEWSKPELRELDLSLALHGTTHPTPDATLPLS